MTNQNPISASAEPSKNSARTAPRVARAAGQNAADPANLQSDYSTAAPSTGKEQKHPRKNGSGKKPAAPRSTRAIVDSSPKVSKTEAALKLLRRKNGAALSELQEPTGWQAHSVRGFLSGTVKKKLGLSLSSEIGKQGARRYRIATADAG